MSNIGRDSSKRLWILTLYFAGLFANITVAAQDYILLTKGGGVTGNTSVFRISSSGDVAKGSGIAEVQYSEFAHLRKARTKKFFRKTRALLKEHSFNNPGNMYTSITMVEGDKDEKIVWGDTAHQPPKDVQKLYQKIEASLNRLTFSKELRK
ncbi:MAG: hypothetical protein QM762_22965 [Chryseolinea sp.]